MAWVPDPQTDKGILPQALAQLTEEETDEQGSPGRLRLLLPQPRKTCSVFEDPVISKLQLNMMMKGETKYWPDPHDTDPEAVKRKQFEKYLLLLLQRNRQPLNATPHPSSPSSTEKLWACDWVGTHPQGGHFYQVPVPGYWPRRRSGYSEMGYRVQGEGFRRGCWCRRSCLRAAGRLTTAALGSRESTTCTRWPRPTARWPTTTVAEYRGSGKTAAHSVARNKVSCCHAAERLCVKGYCCLFWAGGPPTKTWALCLMFGSSLWRLNCLPCPISWGAYCWF